MAKMWFLLLALLPAVALGDRAVDLVGSGAPLLAWSSSAALGNADGQQVHYQVLPAESVTTSIVLGSLGKAAEQAADGLKDMVAPGTKVDKVVVFVGSQLDSAALRKPSNSKSILVDLLNKAKSSVVLPFTSFQGTSLSQELVREISQAGVNVKTVACDSAAADLLSKVQEALEQHDVVMVCSHATEGGLEAELKQLQQVEHAVGTASHVIVYTAQQKAIQRRSLQETTTYKGFGSYTECGPLCQTQVRWLEGLLAVLLLALTSCAGMTCLYLLDTPSKFETMKEGTQN